MRTIPADLAEHLAQEATTTCHAWRVTRRDGVILGFTEHDHDLTFSGTTFLAAGGFSASEAEAATGLSASADEVVGGFSNAAIGEQDLATGRYDGARVELFLVNWAAPDQHVLLNVREIGEVSRTGGQFRAELRSLAHRLSQPQGRVYNRRCDASLGDARCGVDLDLWRGEGAVIAVKDASRIVVSGLGGFASGFFRHGVLTFPDGVAVDVDAHEKRSDGSVELTFWLPLEEPVAAGHTFTLTAGCDKSFATCKARFANHLNFRGFPHVPGADFAYSYVDGERVHDGGPIFE
ncbi:MULTISPECIES: DUF2163 domain-containing protein [unclassified Neorhizobium]|uniref:DUF2163 domain-containing protein n=1 Tax=unclassified Neorhizobium TaxID=2629175 RepID=UPI001FF1B357|nr:MULTISPECIES: DUF2163 domain-containing protein [unclassified Neorhizobium]MCJ9674783.1 DUF2163 domain-containing protein [Neorhizobium sp. SHOUNA12B]MCJ9748105.1 DUF2163 domain-containing protein [Neorhizobium sp. SHOUNA12A]